MENSESGWNPERYRHCMRGGAAHDESRSLGVDPEKAVQSACDARVRRPAQMAGLYLLSGYGEMSFVAKKRQQQSVMTVAFFLCRVIRFLFSRLSVFVTLLFGGIVTKRYK